MKRKFKKMCIAMSLYHYLQLVTYLLNMHPILRKRNKSLKFLNNINIISKTLFSETLNLTMLVTPQRKKKIFMKARSYDWWQRIVLECFDENEWIENFRMRKETFFYICEELRSELEPLPNVLRRFEPVSVEKKVAVSIYFLASCAEYRVVGNQFGIHKSTVCNCVHEFVEAVLKKLTPIWISMPNEDEALIISTAFKKISNIPNIIGCIDGTHVPVTPPSDGYRDYINRKGWPSMVLQGVVDHKYMFRNVCIKQPGAVHDAAVLRSSNLYKYFDKFMPKGTIDIGNTSIGYVLVGDPAYPLLEWLLKGYVNRGLTPEQDSFNVYMNSARVNIEIAYGRLKSRWRCLFKKLDVHHHFVPKMVVVCCTLHNIVEKNKTTFKEQWLEELQQAEILFPQPVETDRSFCNVNAHTIREIICNYLSDNFPLRSSRF